MVSYVFSATVKIYSPFMLVIVPTRGLFLSAIEAPMMLSPFASVTTPLIVTFLDCCCTFDAATAWFSAGIGFVPAMTDVETKSILHKIVVRGYSLNMCT